MLFEVLAEQNFAPLIVNDFTLFIHYIVVLQYIFPDRRCEMDIVETFATGGTDCVFSASFFD
jgi:hypothetical protein